MDNDQDARNEPQASSQTAATPPPETTTGSSEETQPHETREIKHVGVLDLTGMKSPDDLEGITSINHVGLILLPEHLMAKLASIPMKHVGTTVAIPTGDKVKVITGSLKLTGEALANPTGDEDTLVVVGVLHITTPVEKVAYKRLIVVGVVLAPVGSETAIGAAISRLTGSVAYYSGPLRVFTGKESFSSTFFELIEDQTTLVLSGMTTIEPGVTPELLKQKVSQIILAGLLRAPRALLPLLQVLCVERQGQIQALEEEKPSGGEKQ